MLIAQVQRSLFVTGKPQERRREILAQRRRVRRIGRLLVDPARRIFLRFFATPSARIAKLVVRDTQQPRKQLRVAAESVQPPVSCDKRLLRQIVRPRLIAAGELAQKPPHGGLVPLHQLTEGCPVVVADGAGDEFGIRLGLVYETRFDSFVPEPDLGAVTAVMIPFSVNATPIKPGM